jgi:hypothetical protein
MIVRLPSTNNETIGAKRFQISIDSKPLEMELDAEKLA